MCEALIDECLSKKIQCGRLIHVCLYIVWIIEWTFMWTALQRMYTTPICHILNVWMDPTRCEVIVRNLKTKLTPVQNSLSIPKNRYWIGWVPVFLSDRWWTNLVKLYFMHGKSMYPIYLCSYSSTYMCFYMRWTVILFNHIVMYVLGRDKKMAEPTRVEWPLGADILYRGPIRNHVLNLLAFTLDPGAWPYAK